MSDGKYHGNKGLEYYRAYPRDFFEGTIGMDGNLRGFYRMVIDLIYMHDGYLLNDWGHISGNTGYGKTQCKRMMQRLIDQEKIEVSGINEQFFTQKRAKNELKASRKFQENQAKKAAKRWKNNGLDDPGAYPEAMPPQDHKTTRQESPSVSLGISEILPLFADQKKMEADKPNLFEAFWQAYPHRAGVKRGKGPARKKFEKATRDGILPDVIVAGATDFQRDRKALDGFAPDPATWLHNRGWEDEIEDVVNEKATYTNGSAGTANGRRMARPSLGHEIGDRAARYAAGRETRCGTDRDAGNGERED